MYRHKYRKSDRDASGEIGESGAAEPTRTGSKALDKNKRGSEFSRKAVKMASKKGASDAAHPSINKADLPKKTDGAVPKDLMISYSHADKEMMLKVREKLEQNGITVWVDVSGLSAGVDFLSKIGEAIIDAKLFISLLSSNCVASRYCQDELALAYVSDTAIFPLAIEDTANFKRKMDHGMKLQLARYEWTLIEESDFDAKMDELIDKMKSELLRRATDEEEKGKTLTKQPSVKKLERAKSRTKLNRARQSVRQPCADEDAEGKDVMPEKFWKDNFQGAESVDMKKWEEALFTTFKDGIEKYFDTQEHQEWLKAILRREMEVEDEEGKESGGGLLQKYAYDSFFIIDGLPARVWDCVLRQAMESQAMKGVFSMDSSVRVEAVENLGKFRSAAVIDALRDLLTDTDANVRAVASVSLARTEAKDPVTIKFLSKTLNDKDRLVREAGCLALGHLRAKPAVAKLLHLWRNDVISHVREAAQVALQQIGGPEVEKAMHVTKVLADEIRQLTKQ